MLWLQMTLNAEPRDPDNGIRHGTTCLTSDHTVVYPSTSETLKTTRGFAFQEEIVQ